MKYNLPKLNDRNSDLSLRWYVYYSFEHPELRQLKLFKIYISNRLLTKIKRYQKAREIISSYSTKLNTGWNPFAQDPKKYFTVLDGIEFAFNTRKRFIRPRSVGTYQSVIRIFHQFLIEKKYTNIIVKHYNDNMAREFCDWILINKNICPRTYNNYVTHLRTLFNMLIERDIVETNPFRKIKKIPEGESKLVFFTKREREKIKLELPKINYQLYLVSQLIYYCFIRPQEIVRLKICDYDLSARLIRIPPEASKNKRQQVVVIPNQLLKELKEYGIEDLPDNWFLVSTNLKPGPKEIAPTRIADKWRIARKELGIDKTLYHLKHTGAGLAVEAGINIRDLQLQLRHHSLEMTQIYLNKFSKRPSDSFSEKFPDF